MDSLRQKIFSYCKENQSIILGIYDVQRGTGENRTHTILLLTNSGAEFLQPSEDGKMVAEQKLSWFNIALIGNNAQQEVIFVFHDGMMRFTSSKHRRIVEIVVHYIQHILCPFELSHVSVPPLKSSSKPNGSSVVFRLFHLFKNENLNCDSEGLRKVQNAIRLRSPKISDLNFADENEKALPIVFDALAMNTQVKQLGFQKIGPVLFQCMTNKWISLEEIRHFTFAEPVTQDFADCVIKRETKLRGITFVDAEFGDVDVEILVQMVREKSVSSLGFRGGLRAEQVEAVVAVDGFKHVSFLEVNNIPRIDLGKLLPHCQCLVVLSLANLGICIANILRSLSVADVPNLLSLDLSGNVGKSIREQPELPINLLKVHANDIAWDPRSLANFIKACAGHIPQRDEEAMLCVSIARAQIEEGEWGSVFSQLENVQFPRIEMLTWDGNEMCEEFLSCISRFTDLRFLSICGCVTEDKLPLVIDFFRTKRPIRQLNMKGMSRDEFMRRSKSGEDVMVLPNLKGLFEQLETNQEIVHIDVSYNSMNDDSCDCLARWAMNSKTLEFIGFDGTSVTSIEIIIRFCTVLEVRENGLELSYPEFDIMKLAKTEKCNPLVISQLKHRFHNVRKPKAKRKTFVHNPKPFKNRFDVHCNNIDERFLEYLPKKITKKHPIIELVQRKSAPVEAPEESPVVSVPEESNQVILDPVPVITEEEEASESESLYDEEEEEEEEAIERDSVTQIQSSILESVGSTVMETDVSIAQAPRGPPSRSSVVRNNMLRRRTNYLLSDEASVYASSSATMDDPGSPSQTRRVDSVSSKRVVEQTRDRRNTLPRRNVPKSVKPDIVGTPCVKWSFPIKFTPEIDNSVEIEKLDAEFSVENLLSVLRRS